MSNKAKAENLDDINSNGDVKITEENSSVAEFTKRRVPTEQEEEEFEKIVEEEEKDEEIEESLNEIYQDDKGNIVDVKKLEIKKGRGYFFKFLRLLFLVLLIAAAAYGAYFYFFIRPGSDMTAVDFRIEGPSEILTGEEYAYSIYYRNASNFTISNARVEVQYPENFINLSTTPQAGGEKGNVWEIPLIAPKYNGIIKIKGKVIGKQGASEVILANLTYKPDSLTSEFKKEATMSTAIKDTGLDFDFDYVPNSLVGETNDLTLRFNAKEKNFINNFRLTFVPQENIELIAAAIPAESSSTSINMIRPGVWQINEINTEIKTIPVKFKFTKKVASPQDIQFDFEAAGNDSQYYKFYEEKLPYEVMKNDLNLTMIMNGSRDNQGIEFGQTLSYSVVYENKGDGDMKDVVIMAALEGGLIDWTSLDDDLKGRHQGNAIIWTKEQIPALAEFKQGQEGTIDFSVNVIKVSNIEAGRDYQVKSYASFNVGQGDNSQATSSAENRSNTIISQINSDLKLDEAIRYFNEDNIPVGTGPHPPKVGQITSYKVYWTISNSLHELGDLEVTAQLPDYVTWSGKEAVTAGNISYDAATRIVSWNVGRLPITVMQANAEFSISITPSEDDYNKILVLMPGTAIKAADTITGGNIEKIEKAKTTMLEADDIATGDGTVGK